MLNVRKSDWVERVGVNGGLVCVGICFLMHVCVF